MEHVSFLIGVANMLAALSAAAVAEWLVDKGLDAFASFINDEF